MSYKLDLVPISVNCKIVVQVSENGFKPFAIHSTMACSILFIVLLEFSLSCIVWPRLAPLTSET